MVIAPTHHVIHRTRVLNPNLSCHRGNNTPRPELVNFLQLSDRPLFAHKRWTVYLTQHTHTDIGYTRPQTEILPESLRFLDYALDYCDLTDAYPDDAKFRWTCETFWAVREFLKSRPPAQLERLKRRVREGRVEIAGLLLNLSEIATESSIWARRGRSDN